jgi:hypothetical protein
VVVFIPQAPFTPPRIASQAIALLLSASFRYAPFRSFIRAIAFSEKKLHFTAKRRSKPAVCNKKV